MRGAVRPVSSTDTTSARSVLPAPLTLASIRASGDGPSKAARARGVSSEASQAERWAADLKGKLQTASSRRSHAAPAWTLVGASATGSKAADGASTRPLAGS